MAKRKAASSKTRGDKKSKTESTKPITLNNDAPDEAPQVLTVSFSSMESQNDDVGVSSEEDGMNKGSYTDEDDEKEEREEKRGKNEEVKKRGKNKTIRDKDEGESVEKSGSALYKFPMNRVSRIVRSENSDLRIAHEAVFLINKASEKFLELFCSEAYACAFIDHKNHVAYRHLSSVVSKRRRFDFLSDFVPEKVEAENALEQMSEAEK